MKGNNVIAIGRQFGSGGREIGLKLAEKLSIKFYDKELVMLASKKSGISQEMLDNVDEKAINSLLYSLALDPTAYAQGLTPSVMKPDIPLNDKLFIMQSDIVKSLAAESDCVIVGRCADYILSDNERLISVFIHSPLKFRAERIGRLHELPYDKAVDLISKTDKRRTNYYNYYTQQKWGSVDNYHLTIDSSKLGVDRTVDYLMDYCNFRSNN